MPLRAGLLREVIVTPGTSVLFLGDENDPQDDIAITTGDAGDTPPSPKDKLRVGVVFTKDDTLAGTVYADAALTLVPPVTDQEDKAPTDSPVKGRPYIRLSAEEVGLDEALDLTATGFASGGRYEVLLDGEAIKGGDVTADGAGSFAVTIAAPTAKGPHRVEVRAAGDTRAIDATQFLVR